MVRERSAELFSKMMSDKLIGPKVKIVLSKFLPAIFMDAMRDNASASVHMFEGEACRSLSYIRTSETSHSCVTLFCLERLRDELKECVRVATGQEMVGGKNSSRSGKSQ